VHSYCVLDLPNLYSFQVFLRPRDKCTGDEEYSVRPYYKRVLFGAVAVD
jgi:hypothetical protein